MLKGMGKRRVKTRVFPKSSNLKTLVRSLGRMHYASIARQAMKVSKIRDRLLGIVVTDMHKECIQLCARNNKSLLCDSSELALKAFTWNSLISELKVRAPIFSRVLRGMVEVKRRLRVPQKRQKKTRSSRPSEDAIFCVCAAVILRHRNLHMNMLQRIISLMLYNESR